MTEPEKTDAALDPSDSEHTDAPLDPKEAMRLALERKKHNEHQSAAHGINSDRNQGGRANSQMGGKREFRRKSGG
ncbi:DUF5302 domain-containing protein [Tessaracoccus antarcticus]|uniref:DUF5302 domain-containing protein n=1 Tax=Tessaracoccus antarcticus TaxID=2479848 RepID=A0A3M0G9S5_9ACTN|nr:DUF5302 domain-containing protein [Tessaracoccus antarcticus]RMB61725.1 hypothetical protein EAX62_03625 [Tessaracoccus antarcticus]